jgi:hypothetical protein
MLGAAGNWTVLEYVIVAWALCLFAYVVYVLLFRRGRRH